MQTFFCLQGTKKENFVLSFIRKFAPKRFDKFDFYPYVGASGGILVCWASNHSSATTLEKENFDIKLALLLWNLVVVYGPCGQPARYSFVNWLFNLQIDDEELCLLVGDFNLYRSEGNSVRHGYP